MEAPAPELENVSTWGGTVVANLWIPYALTWGGIVVTNPWI